MMLGWDMMTFPLVSPHTLTHTDKGIDVFPILEFPWRRTRPCSHNPEVREEAIQVSGHKRCIAQQHRGVEKR